MIRAHAPSHLRIIPLDHPPAHREQHPSSTARSMEPEPTIDVPLPEKALRCVSTPGAALALVRAAQTSPPPALCPSTPAATPTA